MFVGYSDASIIDGVAYLGLYIEFEDGSVVRRRIAMSNEEINMAEALALFELTNFLKYYEFSRGTILIDSSNIHYGLVDRKGRYYKEILYRVVGILHELKIKSQLIPRKSNKAHRISNSDHFIPSSVISSLNRDIYRKIENYPNYYLLYPAYKAYKELTNTYPAFPIVQRKLNQKIWAGELVGETKNTKEYAFYDLRIKVYKDSIISVSKVNYVVLKHHWSAMKKKKKLRRQLRN